MKGRQLTLAVQLRDASTLESFWAGPNTDLVETLRRCFSGIVPSAGILLYGSPGSGRSHLLTASARLASQHNLRVAHVPLAGMRPGMLSEALRGYDQVQCLILDDVDAVCANREAAMVLLRRLDLARSAGQHVLLSAGAPPDRLDIALPDLRTRLSLLAPFGMHPLDDEQRRQLLSARLAQRGLEIHDDAARWLLNHLPRDTRTLIDAVNRLDHASLAEKRRLTLPFVQRQFHAGPATVATETPQPAD